MTDKPKHPIQSKTFWRDPCMESFSRRKWLLAAIAVGSLPLRLEAKDESAEPKDRTQREFMELVIADIAKQQSSLEAEIAKVKAAGKAAPLFVQIPSLKPFIDFDYWYIDRDLRWAPPAGSPLPSVRVPRGFVSDLASVPSLFWSKYPPIGRYAYAAVVHDYLYWFQTTSRSNADDIMALAMKDAGTNDAAIADFRLALKLAGRIAWDNNKTARESGEKRVLAQFPGNPLISWKDWKAKQGVFKE